MDNSIIRGLMTQYLEALDVLGIDEPLAARAREILASLPPLSIGKHGTVMEWAQDFDEAEPGHRHISQLYALYPAAEITPSTPALYAAAKKTIERRLANGGGHTGWSRAWIINFYARLRNGEAAHENLVALLEKSTLKNMFDNHPPFQIDGNFGGAAGIAEMLLASHDGIIELLPALPAAWQDGEFFGLCARGGFTVSARWEAGRVVFCRIEGQNGTCGRVRINGECIAFTAPFSFG
jgi:alpha-L-fucosidase 2